MIRSSPPAVVFATVLLTIFVAACGGRDTVASRSAEAYRDAVERGLPIDDGHGGHDGAGDEDGAMAISPAHHDDAAAHQADADVAHHVEGGAPIGAADHGAHRPSRDDAARPAGAGAAHGVDHGAPDQAVRHGAAQHQTMPQRGAAHGAMGHDVAGETSATGAGEHGGHEATLHGADVHAAIPPGGLWGPVGGAEPAQPSAAPPLPIVPAPSTSEAMAQLRPDATLAPDRGDTPAQIAVIEAQKSAGGGHEGHVPEEPAEPQQEHREHPPE